MRKLTDKEILSVWHMKVSKFETRPDIPWVLILRCTTGAACFINDPKTGQMKHTANGLFKDFKSCHAKLLATNANPRKFSLFTFLSRGEAEPVEGFQIGDISTTETTYGLLMLGSPKGKHATVATVIESADGKPSHQLCTVYTEECFCELENLLRTVDFFCGGICSDVHGLLEGGELHVGN